MTSLPPGRGQAQVQWTPMPPRLVESAAAGMPLWGAAFMFMRIAAPEFGAVPMAATRVLLAAAMMLAALAWLKQSLQLRTHWARYVAIGAVNTAIPFIAYIFEITEKEVQDAIDFCEAA